MVYEIVPPQTDENGDVVEPEASRPPVISSTDQWLEWISDQLQVFVDKLEELADEDDEDDEVDGSGDPAGDPPADPSGDAAKSDTAKTTPAKKTAEVKGD